MFTDDGDRDDVAGLFRELSRFHETWGVYADPVEMTTGRFPVDWTERLVSTTVTDAERNRTYVARCAEPHDLCVAKLVAGRAKDRLFVVALIETGRIDVALLEKRIATSPLDDEGRAAVLSRPRTWATEP